MKYTKDFGEGAVVAHADLVTGRRYDFFNPKHCDACPDFKVRGIFRGTRKPAGGLGTPNVDIRVTPNVSVLTALDGELVIRELPASVDPAELDAMPDYKKSRESDRLWPMSD